MHPKWQEMGSLPKEEIRGSPEYVWGMGALMAGPLGALAVPAPD